MEGASEGDFEGKTDVDVTLEGILNKIASLLNILSMILLKIYWSLRICVIFFNIWLNNSSENISLDQMDLSTP